VSAEYFLAGAGISVTVLDAIHAVPPDSTLLMTETFGPVLSIRWFTDVEGAIAEINSGAYGLRAGVFTDDHAAIRRFSRELRVGGVMINEGPDFRAEHVPFGGVRQSGLGRGGADRRARDVGAEGRSG
jgi:acyl-CoA reductase-like NAD-dependent aldehyde dehydrogenase